MQNGDGGMTRKKHMGNEPQDDGGDLMDRTGQVDDFGVVDTGPVGLAKAIEDNEAAEEAQSDANLVGQNDRSAIKRANFSRLASKRVTGVLERLSVLKNLANTNTYDWTLEQHNKIFDAIGEKYDEVVKAFVEAKKPKARDKSQLRFEV